MNKKTVLNGKEMGRSIERLAYEVLERHGKTDNLVIVGIQRRGAELAQRINSFLEKREGTKVPLGKLDINLYRDDWTTMNGTPQINKTDIAFDINGKDVLLVDDVLFSGRTIRAALEAIIDFGRPQRVELLVLVDRGHRELPIHADYIGKKVDTTLDEQVDVLVQERDNQDLVVLTKKKR